MRARTVAWRAGCALATVAVALGCGAAEPPFRPLADNKLLMQAVVDPQADVIWEAVQTIVTEQGTQEIRPQTEEEWVSVRNSAVTLAEAGNLLMMSPRAKEPPRSRSRHSPPRSRSWRSSFRSCSCAGSSGSSFCNSG